MSTDAGASPEASKQPLSRRYAGLTNRLRRGIKRHRPPAEEIIGPVPVQTINPETWDAAIGRLALVGRDLVRWSWMAIKRDDQWHVFAITVGVLPSTAGDRELVSDQVRMATTYLSAENATDNLRKRIVGGPGIEHFETQDIYAAYWLPPGGDFGFGRPSGWPEYYVSWPIAGLAPPRQVTNR